MAGGTDRHLLREKPIEINAGRQTATVQNTGDHPVQVGSHYHFFELNRARSSSSTRHSHASALVLLAGRGGAGA